MIKRHFNSVLIAVWIIQNLLHTTPNQAESFVVIKHSLLIANHLIYYLCIPDYPDFYQMYDALVKTREVEGILGDIYTASYYMEKIDDPRLAVSMMLSAPLV